jgi:hypothetical protein
MGDESLVQPEGVNAGSAEELADDGHQESQDAARKGGRPEAAPKQNLAMADVDPEPGEGPELAGAPAVGPEGSAGQDEGNQ